MKRREETCSGARPCPNSFLDQKIHAGSTTDCGFDAVYRTMFPRNKGKIIIIGER
jgi:hypothetical protein